MPGGETRGIISASTTSRAPKTRARLNLSLFGGFDLFYHLFFLTILVFYFFFFRPGTISKSAANSPARSFPSRMRTTMCSSPRSVGRVLVIDYSSSARDVPSSTPTTRCQTKRTPFFFPPLYFFSRSCSRAFVLAFLYLPRGHRPWDGAWWCADARRETATRFSPFSSSTTDSETETLDYSASLRSVKSESLSSNVHASMETAKFYSVCCTLACTREKRVVEILVKMWRCKKCIRKLDVVFVSHRPTCILKLYLFRKTLFDSWKIRNSIC